MSLSGWLSLSWCWHFNSNPFPPLNSKGHESWCAPKATNGDTFKYCHRVSACLCVAECLDTLWFANEVKTSDGSEGIGWDGVILRRPLQANESLIDIETFATSTTTSVCPNTQKAEHTYILTSFSVSFARRSSVSLFRLNIPFGMDKHTHTHNELLTLRVLPTSAPPATIWPPFGRNGTYQNLRPYILCEPTWTLTRQRTGHLPPFLMPNSHAPRLWLLLSAFCCAPKW